MTWIKYGLIFQPPAGLSWLVSHSAVPVALHLEGDLYRIYFTGRDHLNRSHIGFIELDLKQPHKTLFLSEQPILTPGPLGSFDEHGVMTSWMVQHQSKLYLYYTGWSRGLSVPFVNSIGLAVSSDDGRTFRKFSEGPVLSRNVSDAYFVANPCVLRDARGWRMWYLSGVRWELEKGAPRHFYHIRYAHSKDGIRWEPSGKVCIDFASPDEYAISRPCILRENGVYRMWYSYRGDRYRIGYAESSDGLCWERLDHKAGIDISASGWDSEMIEYTFVFRRDDHYYMLYNGNGYGRSGVGLALLA
jgi:predicted GH43/DUF377 family glycosyl hydrolase